MASDNPGAVQIDRHEPKQIFDLISPVWQFAHQLSDAHWRQWRAIKRMGEFA